MNSQGIVTVFLIFMIEFFPVFAAAELPQSRYFFSGNGRIALVNEKSGISFNGEYREKDGSYNVAALKAIHGVFGARYGDPIAEISGRLIEFLDYITDHLRRDAQITVISGWRSPEYNRSLRDKGRLAAKASLHQYGMAVDMKIGGVPSRQVWDYVKASGFGGTGYYHGDYVHVDVGPHRSWDEKTSGVGTGISDDNKLIGLVTDRDIYFPGERVTLRFIRMTAFPIGVSPEFVLERSAQSGTSETPDVFRPSFAVERPGDCPQFHDIGQMMGIGLDLPGRLPAGRYRIRGSFCEKEWPNMPKTVITPAFEVFTP